MVGADEETTPASIEDAGSPLGGLHYSVELWNIPRTGLERIIARAETLQVARALFNAARAEHPARLIVLRQGERSVDRSV